MRMDHVAFEVSDLDKGIAFYGNALGFIESWRHRNEAENEAIVTSEDSRVCLRICGHNSTLLALCYNYFYAYNDRVNRLYG